MVAYRGIESGSALYLIKGKIKEKIKIPYNTYKMR